MMTQMNAANAVPCFLMCDEVRMDNLMACRMQVCMQLMTLLLLTHLHHTPPPHLCRLGTCAA